MNKHLEINNPTSGSVAYLGRAFRVTVPAGVSEHTLPADQADVLVDFLSKHHKPIIVREADSADAPKAAKGKADADTDTRNDAEPDDEAAKDPEPEKDTDSKPASGRGRRGSRQGKADNSEASAE